MRLKSFWISQFQIMNRLELLLYNWTGRQKGIPNGVDETLLRSKQVWNHHLLTIVHICRPEFVYNGVGSQNRRVVSLKEVFRHQIYMSVAKYYYDHSKIKCKFINLTFEKCSPIFIFCIMTPFVLWGSLFAIYLEVGWKTMIKSNT